MDNLDKYMKKQFPNIELKSPLFYNSPISIRFDIGGDFFVEKEKAENVLYKSLTLFNALNNITDDIFFIMFVDCWDKNPISVVEGEVIKAINKFVKTDTDYKINKKEQDYRYKEDDDDIADTVTLRYWTKIKVKNLDVVGLLKGKIYSAFSGEEYNLIGDLFIINSTNNTIFHLYDERGLDIVSQKKETIRKLYIKFDKWILEYDRKRIDEIFKNN